MAIAPADSGDDGLLGRLNRPWPRLLLLAAVALLLRWSTFGDPNLTADEGFYHAVGLAMHDGALPYVDVWDRKPLGLFLIYWAITGLSAAPMAYQLAASACAVATAWTIGRIVRRWSGPQGSLLAGLVYLLWLTPLFGFGGQSPVFYNLLIALAAEAVLRARRALARGQRSRAADGAMLLAGLAITVKTTAVFEGAYFGIVCLAATWESRLPTARVVARGLIWSALGLAPTMLIALFYAATGHWGEYWHAMVGANLAKGTDWGGSLLRLRLLWLLLLPLVLVALTGLAVQREGHRGFVAGWLAAAMVGLCAVPNFYPHYALPLLAALCVSMAALLDRRWIGATAFALLAFFALRAEPPLRPGQADRSRANFAALAQAISAHDGGRGLLVYAGPAQLYAMTGHAFPTPLAFETHLSQQAEQNASHLDTIAELRRVLATRPGAVVVPVTVRNGPVIAESWALVNGYARTHCRRIAARHVEDWLLADDLVVWGNCRG